MRDSERERGKEEQWEDKGRDYIVWPIEQGKTIMEMQGSKLFCFSTDMYKFNGSMDGNTAFH